MSQRGPLRGVAVGGLGPAAAVLVGCDDDDDDTDENGAETATAGGASEAEVKRGGVFHPSRTSSLSDIPDPHTSLAAA